MIHLTSGIVTALSWALVHALWQGLLLYMLLRVLLAVIPGNYASTRYMAAVSALGILTISFLATIIYYYAGMQTVGYTIADPTVQNTTASVMELQQPKPDAGVVQAISLWFNANTGVIVNIYLGGMLLLLVRIAYNLYTLKNLKYTGTISPDANWRMMLGKCMHKLAINGNVRLYFSTKVLVPMVMGNIKPVILMPVAIANKLTMHEAEAVLLHELAHIRRHDYLVNMVQLFIETILFYNPFVWLISAVIRREREHCCDDMVIRATIAPLPYAKALAALETYRQQPAIPALAATGNNHQLFNRIKRIMEMKNHNINYGQLMAVLLAVVLLAGAFTFLAPEVNAQSKKDKKKETAGKNEQPKTVKKHIVINSDVDINDDNQAGKKQIQKKILVVKNGDTLKNLSVNKSLSETDAVLEEAFGMLDEMDIDQVVDGAMADIDWKNLHDSIDIEIDGREISKEVREALAEARREMATARVNMAEASKEYRAAMAEAQKEIAAAQKVVEMSRKERAQHDRKGKPAPRRLVYSSSHDHILDAMEQDGLISRKKGYKIEKKGDELYIDGIKQSKEVFKKYEPLINSRNLTITGNNRSINIKVEN